MRRKIITALLAVALLMTLIPMVSVSANAASDFGISDDCIEIIKQWEGFCAKPYWDYRQWTVGYGTRVPDGKLEQYQKYGISKEEATVLLHGMIDEMEVELNRFIDKYNLPMTQGKFDALLSLTFNCGPNWMWQTSTFRTSVIEGWTGNDFIFAIGQWSTAGGVTVPALIRRRLAEACMYLQGTYGYAPPENYAYVRFDANGGKSEIITQGFDLNTPAAIRAVPEYPGYIFEGWFTDPTGGEKVEILDAGVRNYMLYAHWSDPAQSPTQETINGTPVSYQRQIATGVLNSFDQPVKGALVVNAYQLDEIVDISAEYTDNSGTKWGKVKNGGWINLSYTREPETDILEGPGVTITVTATDVNVRRGPGTGYALVGKADKGDRMVITQTATGTGYTWGKFADGWICLQYTNYDAVVNGDVADKEDTEQDNAGSQTKPDAEQMGTVVVSGGLRIRSGAGTDQTVLGYLSNGARVKILEKKTVDGMVWGRIDRGWISMDYVRMDGTENEDTDADQGGTQPETPIQTGTVVLSSDRLNVRTGPSTGYPVVGSLGNGTKVEILEKKIVGTTAWGRIEDGWICLDYVRLDDAEIPAEPEKPGDNTNDNDSGDADSDNTNTGNDDSSNTDNENTGSGNTDSGNSGNTGTENNSGSGNSNTTVTGVIVLSSERLNIRKQPGTDHEVVGSLASGTKVTITEQKQVGNKNWGRIDQGWICMDYVRLDSQQEEVQKVGGTISAGGTSLHVRTGPGTSYPIAGYVEDGARVEILERKTVNDTQWGRTEKGWISLSYVLIDGEAPSKNETPQTKSGVVIADCLRVRSGAGLDSSIVGALYTGEKITVLETKDVDGMTWGRIDKGWVSMDYIQ